MGRSFFFTLFVFPLSFATAQGDLSLSDAIRKGLAQNYDIQIEERIIDIAENTNSWGEAGRYPSLNLTFDQKNTWTDIDNPASFLGGTVQNNTLEPGVGINWVLFDGFGVSLTKNQLEQLQEESQGNAKIVVSNTIQAIILGYYTADLEKERLDVFRINLNLSRDKYEYLKIKKSFGAAVTSDLLLEEGNYLTDSTNYINQQLRYRNSLRDLNFLMGEEDPETVYELIDELGIETFDYELEILRSKMESDNVDLKKMYVSQAILKYETRLSRAGRSATVSFSGGYLHNRNRQDLSGAVFSGENPPPPPPDPITAKNTTYYANFGLTFNLFNGGRINRAIQNAMIQEDIGNLNIDRMKLSLNKDLNAAYDQYTIRRQLYGINQRNRQAARLNLDISQEKYRNGTINSFDFRTVQNRLLVAALTELQSLYDLVESNINLMRLTGGILEEYR